MTTEMIIGALAIFGLRIINNTIGTISVIVIVKQQRILASVLTFLETLIWAVVIANVIKDLNNWLNVVAYCGGFAAGSYVGMMLEARLINSYMTAVITTGKEGHTLATALRQKGYGVTEVQGEGRDGKVTLLHCTVNRKRLNELLQLVHQINPNTFVSVEEVRTVQRGYIQPMSIHRQVEE